MEGVDRRVRGTPNSAVDLVDGRLRSDARGQDRRHRLSGRRETSDGRTDGGAAASRPSPAASVARAILPRPTLVAVDLLAEAATSDDVGDLEELAAIAADCDESVFEVEGSFGVIGELIDGCHHDVPLVVAECASPAANEAAGFEQRKLLGGVGLDVRCCIDV